MFYCDCFVCRKPLSDLRSCSETQWVHGAKRCICYRKRGIYKVVWYPKVPPTCCPLLVRTVSSLFKPPGSAVN